VEGVISQHVEHSVSEKVSVIPGQPAPNAVYIPSVQLTWRSEPSKVIENNTHRDEVNTESTSAKPVGPRLPRLLNLT
jgi:hypothetical protein